MSISQHSQLYENLSSSIPNSQMFGTLLSLQVLDEADELQNRLENRENGSLKLGHIDDEIGEDQGLHNSEDKACGVEPLTNRRDSQAHQQNVMKSENEPKPENNDNTQNNIKKHSQWQSNGNSLNFNKQQVEKQLDIENVENEIEQPISQTQKYFDGSDQSQNIHMNDLANSCVETKNKSSINRDKVRQNFEILLGKVYGIIEEIEQKNEEALMARCAVQQKIKYDRNVVSVRIGQTLTEASQKKQTSRKIQSESAIPTTINPNISKKIPKLFLYEQAKQDTEISIVSHRNLSRNHMITYQDTQRFNTSRSQCSRRSNRSSRGINVVSTRKNNQNSSLKRSNYISLKPKSNEKKLNTFNLQSNRKEKQPKKKIKLCHKRFSGCKQNKSDAENRTITLHTVSSPKTEGPLSNQFDIKNYFNAKRVSFRLF